METEIEILRIISIGRLVLPKGAEKDPFLGAIGAIPDTQEWLEMKVSLLEPTDTKGVSEWQKYVIGKAKEFIVNRVGEDEYNRLLMEKFGTVIA